jgi:flagellar hook assembly protein FlgD
VLSQNYPNPFNPSTVISYDLLQASDVGMNIYDLSGRRVKTLVSGIQAAGAHRVIWDGRSDKGEDAASGVYVYSLDAGGHVQTRKMVLTR